MATAPALAPELPVTIEDIRAAHAVIAGQVERTPCLHSRTLSAITGAEVWLKFENLQFTASFKERGALNKLLKLTADERARGVITASAGNHAQGVAYHARRLGVPATVVMPKPTPIVKVTQTQDHGATVILEGETFDDAQAHAWALQAERGLTYVHPFDDLAVIAGQGTVGIEMLETAPDLDVIVVPLGGGGLMSGIAIATRALKPSIQLIGSEAEMYPSVWARLNGAEAAVGGETLAEGIAVKEPGRITLPILKALLDDMALVSERDLERAVAMLLTIEKTVVEGAGAAGLAALLADPARFAGRRVGLVLCGGNIDTRLLANVLLRDLVREGRIARLRVILKDRPGQLSMLAKVFEAQGVNILEVHHHRVYTRLPAKGLVTDIECETRGRPHLDRLVSALRVAGYDVRPVELD
ncbi:MAG: threonine ammonia-lyase [Sphingomonadaceae bacterium]|nr:threonine ammonia-lyase [Sphingomonadaceae bacterium]